MRLLLDVFADAGLDWTGWDLTLVRAISNDGNSIVGDGVNPGGIEEGWLARLGPVPEPSTLVLLVLMAIALVPLRHRRRNSAQLTPIS